MFDFLHHSSDADVVTEIWQRYQRGVEHHNRAALYSNTERAHQFFEGDQWSGLEAGGEQLPFYNFIQPVCEHKIASVAMNNMAIHYAPMGHSGDQRAAMTLCDALNALAAQTWETQKMDRLMWEAIKEACIAGDSYVYFYNGALDAQLVDNVNLYLADEQQTDLQKQPYLLFYERRTVDQVQQEARANGLSEEEIDRIVPDEADLAHTAPHAANEVKGVEKCACLLCLERRDGVISFSRATKTVVYQPETPIAGLSLYPVASLCWLRKKGAARGNGEVSQLIPNQIAANRLLARREISTKMTAFSRPVFSSTAILNREDIDRVGAPLEVSGAVGRVADAFAYIAPSPMSADAKGLQDELISVTRNLAGAGDAALGNINPEHASGAAIIAVRDQQAIALNEQVAMYRQFVEDIALIWYAMWAVYHPEGLTATVDGMQVVLPARALTEKKVSIRVDVSPQNPFSKFAQEQALQNLFSAQAITFAEYVEALEDDAVLPKAKLSEILDRRRAVAAIQQQASLQQKYKGVLPDETMPLPSGPENHGLRTDDAGGFAHRPALL